MQHKLLGKIKMKVEQKSVSISLGFQQWKKQKSKQKQKQKQKKRNEECYGLVWFCNITIWYIACAQYALVITYPTEWNVNIGMFIGLCTCERTQYWQKKKRHIQSKQ